MNSFHIQMRGYKYLRVIVTQTLQVSKRTTTNYPWLKLSWGRLERCKWKQRWWKLSFICLAHKADSVAQSDGSIWSESKKHPNLKNRTKKYGEVGGTMRWNDKHSWSRPAASAATGRPCLQVELAGIGRVESGRSPRRLIETRMGPGRRLGRRLGRRRQSWMVLIRAPRTCCNSINSPANRHHTTQSICKSTNTFSCVFFLPLSALKAAF